MSKVSPFDLYLPNITRVEKWAYADNFKHYADTVCAQLYKLVKHMTFEDIQKLTGLKTPADIVITYPDRFVSATDGNDTAKKIWFDLEAELIITTQSHFDLYQKLFCYVIKYIDLTDLHEFLSYQFEKGFEKNLEKYIDFLVPQVQMYEGTLLNQKQVNLIGSWVELAKHKAPETAVKSKGKLPRTPEDGRTVLTLDQTALLIHQLRELKVFDRDEYLTNKSAGIAFEILTGYSADAVRVKLGDLGKINTERNLKNIQLVLSRLLGQIKIDIEKIG